MMMRYRIKYSIRKISCGISPMIPNDCSKKEYLINDASIKPNSKMQFLETMYLPRSIHHLRKLDRHVLSSVSQHSQIMCRYLNFMKPVQIRSYSTSPLPSLTDLEIHELPILFGDMNNLLITFFAIKPQLDRDFSLTEFLQTSNKVVAMVSNKLATKDFESLQDMVTADVFEQLQRNLPRFTESELSELVVNPNDVVVSFIRNMFITEDSNQGLKHLSIHTVHHFVPRFEDLKKRFSEVNLFAGTTSDIPVPPTVYIVNYKFLRTFNLKTDQAGDWVISGLNYRRKKPEPLNSV